MSNSENFFTRILNTTTDNFPDTLSDQKKFVRYRELKSETIMPSLLLLFSITFTIQTISVVNIEAAKCGTRERLSPHFHNNVHHNNHNNDNNRYYQTEWQTGDAAAATTDGINEVSNYRVSDIMKDGDAVKRRNAINKLTFDDNQNFETLLSGIIAAAGNNNNRYGNNKLVKRSHYDDNNVDSGGYVNKNKRASFPSVYPEIMTDSGKKTLNDKAQPLLDDAPADFDLTYNALLNQLNQLQTSGQLASFTNANGGRALSSDGSSSTTNERTKANKPMLKTDGTRETADVGTYKL